MAKAPAGESDMMMSTGTVRFTVACQQCKGGGQVGIAQALHVRSTFTATRLDLGVLREELLDVRRKESEAVDAQG